MIPPSAVLDNIPSILQDMSSPSFTQPSSSVPIPIPAPSNEVPGMVSPTVSNSSLEMTESLSDTDSWPPSLSSLTQQLTALPKTAVAKSSVSKTTETNFSKDFKRGCKITANSDGDEEWDFLDDFKPSLPLPVKTAIKTRKDKENPDPDEEWEVLDYDKSLIPLSVEIAMETGKHEKLLFEDQCKSYKFVNREWKEQNLCIVKIFHHSLNGRVRLLMRKEQEVLKACANHYITPDMKIHSLKNSDLAWTWIAQEFINEELKPEHFCAHFKDAELAAAFKTAFIKAVNIAKDLIKNNLSRSKVPINRYDIFKSFALKSASALASWFCPLCEVNNGAEKLFCVICKTTKPFSCREFEITDGAEKCFYSSECDTYLNFSIIANDLRTINSCCSEFVTPGLKLSSKAEFWCCPVCDVTNVADNWHCIICEASKPQCCDYGHATPIQYSSFPISSDDEMEDWKY